VLTLIGGGVFGNSLALIWDAIQWAIEEVRAFSSQDLDVIVNGRNLGVRIDLDRMVLPTVRKHRGAILIFDRLGLVAIRR
jgi:hypothetical protein